jgi:16S rRNA (cytosine967-C5)-methyltransferase
MKQREYIVNTLYRVIHEGGYASLILRESSLSEKEMPYVSECVYGTLRNYTYLESQWHPYVSHVKPRTALLLDTAVYQIQFMRTPDYATVNEMVALAEPGQRPFVNAVLRKVIANGAVPPADLSVETSHPAWILNLWKAHYGAENAERIARSDQKVPCVYARVNTLKTNRHEMEKYKFFHFIDDEIFTSDIPVQNTEAFLKGMVLIQNRSSVEVVRAMRLQNDMQVLDVCASPGTKTQMMACCMHNTGHITACDLYEKRAGLIEQLMEKTGVTNTSVSVQDGTAENVYPRQSFDRILCDVPCSGLGDLSHKPEIRWHLKSEDLDALVQTQEAILKNASAYLKTGGILVYSTCTLDHKENENQIKKFLKEHSSFHLQSERTIFPFEEEGDGFYIAVMSKDKDDMVE